VWVFSRCLHQVDGVSWIGNNQVYGQGIIVSKELGLILVERGLCENGMCQTIVRLGEHIVQARMVFLSPTNDFALLRVDFKACGWWDEVEELVCDPRPLHMASYQKALNQDVSPEDSEKDKE